MVYFYENLKRICSQKGTTPTGLAKDLGIPTSLPVNWKRGGVPRADTLRKIADYFGVTTDYLLGNESEEMPQNKKTGVRIPVYGSVAAGIPIEAITDIEDWEEIGQEMALKGEYFALKIRGNSMEPRICNGDVVIVRRQDDVDSGNIAVVMINGGDATCKKIKKAPEGVYLLPLNNDFDPMFFNNKQIAELPVRVLGRVVEVRGKI